MTSDAATRPKLVLASGSARRLQLLQQVGIEPDALMPADIDETPLKNELPRTRERRRLVETRVRFKRLSSAEIESYLASGEWRGKAGGYAIQGLAGAFVVRLIGSYTSVVGLPLYEAMALLAGEGFPIHFSWKHAA